MKILLTGAGGQLGRAVLEAFTRHEVIPRRHAELDITDPERVRAALDEERPELVLNAAASTDVDGAETDPETAFAGNAVGPRYLAVATADLEIPLLHISSDYVFDGEADRPYHEFDATRPISVYGRSKLSGEEAVRSFNRRHYIVRTAWLYGTRGRNFALTMRSQAHRQEVRVVNDQRGSPTYVAHLAPRLEALIETGAYGTYHLAGSGVASWFELACALYRELGLGTPVRPVPTEAFPLPAPRPRYSALTSRQQPRLSLPPWEEGVRDFATRLREEEAGQEGGGSGREQSSASSPRRPR